MMKESRIHCCLSAETKHWLEQDCYWICPNRYCSSMDSFEPHGRDCFQRKMVRLLRQRLQ